MKQACALLLLLGACRPSHAYVHPAALRFEGPPALEETWDAQAVAGIHLHPVGDSDCAELRRLMREGGRAAAEAGKIPGDAAARMADVMDALISQTHGAPYGGAGKLTLALRRFPEGRLEHDRSLFLVVPDLRAEEVERSFREPELQAFLHENQPQAASSLKSGTLKVRRTAPDRLEFAVDVVLGSGRVRTEVDARVHR